MAKHVFELALINTILTMRNSRRVYCSVENSKKYIEEMGHISSKPYVIQSSHKNLWKEELVEGLPCFIRKGTSKAFLFYLHGGSYIEQAGKYQISMIDAIAKGTNATVILPVYPLAPHVTFEASYAKVEAVYDKLLSSINPHKIILVGDSAGAGFALGLYLLRAEKKKPLPDKLILVSPFVDITMSNPEIAEFEPKDHVLSSPGIIEMANAWAGDADPKDYRLSPIYGDLSSVKSLMLFVAGADILCPDGRLLKKKLEALHKKVVYIEEPGHPHDYPVLPMSAAKTAIQKMIEYVKE